TRDFKIIIPNDPGSAPVTRDPVAGGSLVAQLRRPSFPINITLTYLAISRFMPEKCPSPRIESN
ncbi:MAG TPA: hypothetical protein VG123_08460, partial [Streptosporangiaceae bacterium]|nr:hypothetical protein [Streptosporangiaceae bacterium]